MARGERTTVYSLGRPPSTLGIRDAVERPFGCAGNAVAISGSGESRNEETFVAKKTEDVGRRRGRGDECKIIIIIITGEEENEARRGKPRPL